MSVPACICNYPPTQSKQQDNFRGKSLYAVRFNNLVVVVDMKTASNIM